MPDKPSFKVGDSVVIISGGGWTGPTYEGPYTVARTSARPKRIYLDAPEHSREWDWLGNRGRAASLCAATPEVLERMTKTRAWLEFTRLCARLERADYSDRVDTGDLNTAITVLKAILSKRNEGSNG